MGARSTCADDSPPLLSLQNPQVLSKERAMPIDPEQLQAFANDGEEMSPDSDDENMDEGGEEKFSQLIPALEEAASQISECCDELDPDILVSEDVELGDADAEILWEGYDALPEEFQTVFEEVVGENGLSMDESQSLANYLYQENMIEDPDVVAGWLYRVADMLAGEDSEDDDEEEESDEEDFDYEDGDAELDDEAME